jgi:dienelactone hydrolase
MRTPNRFRPAAIAALFLTAAALLSRADQAPAPATASSTTQQTRDAFLKMIDRPKVDLAAEETFQSTKDGISRYHFTYASEAGQRVPGLLLAKPEILKDGNRHPVVIDLHGTGGNKEAESARLIVLAKASFIAIAIDGRYHGERGKPADYNAAIAKAFTDGKSHPLYYDTIWDLMRLVDYLDTRPDVDPKRIGMIGISKGGIETWLTAAVDPRIAVAIPCISAQSFAWGLDNDAWHHRVGTVQAGFDAAAKSAGIDRPDAKFARQFYDRVIPGIYGQFDCPQMLPLIAPRPLLVISGDKDPINPVEGLHLCEQSTAPVYAADGVSDRFKVILQPNTGHAVTKSAEAEAVAWFQKWLDNPPAAGKPGPQ